MSSQTFVKRSTLFSNASASLESRLLHRCAESRPAVASSSSSLLERARARLERSRPWARTSQGNSRSRVTSTATTTSTTSTRASQLSFIPPPPPRTVAQRHASTNSSDRDSSLSFIPAPKVSYASATTRPESLRSQALTVSTTSTRPSLLELTFLAPSHHSAKASAPSSSSVPPTTTRSSATTASSGSATTVSSGSSAAGSSAHPLSFRTRTRIRAQALRTLQDSRRLRMELESRRPSAAPTLSSAKSSIRAKASTVTTSSAQSSEPLSSTAPKTDRLTGTRPPPSTTSSRTDASLLGLSFIGPPAKGTRAPSTVSSKTDASLLGLSFIPPGIPAKGTRPPPSSASTCSSTGSLESFSRIEPPKSSQSLPPSEVLARARAVRAAVESSQASAVDNRKSGKTRHSLLTGPLVSRPPVARQVSSLAPSLRHPSFRSADSGSDFLPGQRSPATSDTSSSKSRPVKRVRFGDDHSDRELQDVKVTVHQVKRWIGILQYTEPGSWILENGQPLCGVGRAIHCYTDPRRIISGQLVAWELIPGTTDEYDYTFGSSRLAPSSIDIGPDRVSHSHRGCSREHTTCNRWPRLHGNANGPSDAKIRIPEWNLNDVFRPDVPFALDQHHSVDDW